MANTNAIEVIVVESVAREIERNQQQVQQRAYEKFMARGGQHGQDVEDWLSAENELARIGGIDVSQREGAFVAQVDLSELEAEELELRADSRSILIQSRSSETPRVFWWVEFPAPINPNAVQAERSHGIARLIAPFSETVDALDA